MKIIKTNIIPHSQTFVKLKRPHEINYEAICIFSAIGFFLDQDCYYKDEICLRPATINTIDENGYLIKSESYFKWHYAPKYISFEKTLNAYSTLFESVIDKQVKDNNVILPLSGGLDSRTQAVALFKLKKQVTSYSYDFENGYKEADISEVIAKECGFSFQRFIIKKGYLWERIKQLSEINGAYSEFTHPRQMAVLDHLKEMNGVFSLGHWGDVLFDKQTDKQLSLDEEVDLILKKILKRGGASLASQLWNSWKLDGEFMDYLKERIKSLLLEVNIENSSAKIRAFKSLFWAPRWTSTNLSIFETAQPVTLPYYSNEICEFICGVPEKFLADRQLQIAYITKNNKALSRIVWQENKPYNLLNYKYNKTPYNLPYRFGNKLKRVFNKMRNIPYVQRNWELQFLGEANQKYLEKYLFNNGLNVLVPEDIVKNVYSNFKDNNSLQYAHAISMLLTLSLWNSNIDNAAKD
jgi:hypothetical protein